MNWSVRPHSSISSNRPWLNSDHDRARLDLISAGASLATLMQLCMRDSGMFFIQSMDGASAEMKHRKVSFVPSETTSSSRSSATTHVCMR